MIRPGDFENLFTAETQEQAQGMLIYVVSGIRMALAELPDTEENSVARAYLYMGMSKALCGKVKQCKSLKEFLSVHDLKLENLTPEQWNNLQQMWSQLVGDGIQNGNGRPKCAI